MVYSTILPAVFPWQATVPEDVAEKIAIMLILSTQPMDDGFRPSSGSSFAILPNIAGDFQLRKVWVSDVSYRRLVASGCFDSVEWSKVDCDRYLQ